MGLTNKDVESAYLNALDQTDQWQVEFLASWYQNEIDQALMSFWGQMDPRMKEYFRLTKPQAYQAMEERVRSAKERGNGATS